MNKIIAITGATGGLGSKLCFTFAKMGYDLIFIDRNLQKSEKLANTIKEKYPNTKIKNITCDLQNLKDVKNTIQILKTIPFNVLILNSGIYNVPKITLESGYNNVFQVNFLSQYILVRKLLEENVKFEKLIAIGSIAHNYSKINLNDIDFSSNSKPSLIYGNSKRFLMFGLYELFKNENNVKLSIAHPGVTLTNMTNHYHKSINWLVKIGIKALFPSPKKASKNIISALYNDCSYFEWIGPKIFNIWGSPKKKKLKTCSEKESIKIGDIATEIYLKVCKEFNI